jgi:ubiquitin C-terminal hydrolase
VFLSVVVIVHAFWSPKQVQSSLSFFARVPLDPQLPQYNRRIQIDHSWERYDSNNHSPHCPHTNRKVMTTLVLPYTYSEQQSQSQKQLCVTSHSDFEHVAATRGGNHSTAAADDGSRRMSSNDSVGSRSSSSRVSGNSNNHKTATTTAATTTTTITTEVVEMPISSSVQNQMDLSIEDTNTTALPCAARITVVSSDAGDNGGNDDTHGPYATATLHTTIEALMQLKQCPRSEMCATDDANYRYSVPPTGIVMATNVLPEEDIDAALDEIFAADDDTVASDNDVFLPAQQASDEMEELCATTTTETTATTGSDSCTHGPIVVVAAPSRSCADNSNALTEIYSTPMSSPIRTSFINSTALVSWPLQSWSNNCCYDNNYHSVSSIPYSGLSNLGNTCYMAAALQMLSCLSSFTEAVRMEPPSEYSNTNLRMAYLDLVDRLQYPGTVSPDAFKEALDERSSLFLGYRQQDSHEFLTTLLDLLDEDYKKKQVVEDAEESMDVTYSQSEHPMDRSIDDLDRITNSKKQKTEKSIQPMDTDDSISSQHQSRQIDDVSYRSQQSLSELDVDAIDRLLHGTSSSDILLQDIVTATSNDHTGGSDLESEQPHFKLIGGRMNTTDVILTPYSSSNMDQNDGNSASTRRLTHQGLLQQPISSTRVVEDEKMETSDDDDNESDAVLLSPIDTRFTTEVRVRLTCDSCKLTRSHKETFLHLSLEIGSDTEICSSSIEDGIRRFFAPCTQELKCEKCFCDTATQCTEITKLPQALLLHLKRFIVDFSADWSNVTYRKNQSAVHLNEDLSLDEEGGALYEFLAPDCTVIHPTKATTTTPTSLLSIQQRLQPNYVLRSVVNHIGSSANCGHYTADAQRGRKGEKKQWIRFNDSYVSYISATEAIEQSKQTAYMCLYVLV